MKIDRPFDLFGQAPPHLFYTKEWTKGMTNIAFRWCQRWKQTQKNAYQHQSPTIFVISKSY